MKNNYVSFAARNLVKTIGVLLVVSLFFSLAACSGKEHATEIVVAQGMYTPKDAEAPFTSALALDDGRIVWAFFFTGGNNLTIILKDSDADRLSPDGIVGTYEINDSKLKVGKCSFDFHVYGTSIFVNGIEFVESEDPAADEPAESSGALPESPAIEQSNNMPYVGEIIRFAGTDWLVLEVEKEKMLVISQYLFGPSLINEVSSDYTWETSTMREYLNNEYYSVTFSDEEKACILETTLPNADSQRFGTFGGNETTDRVFLLSIDEVVRYFGDSGQLANGGSSDERIDDQYNNKRRASYSEANNMYDKQTGLEGAWWLRSPGESSDSSATVSRGGYIDLEGIYSSRTSEGGGAVFSNPGGIRPAMWLLIE